MTLDEQHKATTLRLLSRIPNGRFTTSMKVAPTAGMATAFILMGDNKDEVDMEWLGWKPDAVETTYHMKGILDEENEPLKRLPVSGGNASASYHTYAIEKTDTTVKWFVDGVEGRTTTNSDPAKFPEGVEWLMFGVWDGSSVHEWAGTAKYNG
ncbi:concanavalin A-like lectin/glucanase domain-containing protein, partial [Dimargaris cristalligena]